MTDASRDLLALTKELLELYNHSEHALIEQWSSTPGPDWQALARDVADYERRIEEIESRLRSEV